MSVKEDIRNQIIESLSGAKFPINSPEELLEALPNGADTTYKSGDISFKFYTLDVFNQDDFPFNSVTEVSDTIIHRARL